MGAWFGSAAPSKRPPPAPMPVPVAVKAYREIKFYTVSQGQKQL
jgi:hypothetical protein